MNRKTIHNRRRSMVLAPKAMVATSQPLAVQVGIDILKRGGSAVDAAIAVNAMLAALGETCSLSCGMPARNACTA